MDPSDVELARRGLAVFSEVVSPEYDALRAQLLGRLAASEITVADMRATEQQKTNNFELVSGFMDLLPRQPATFDSSGSSLEVADTYTAQQLKASLLWLSEPFSFDGKYGTTKPYYIVGRHDDTTDTYAYGRSPVTHLLLFSVTEDPKPIKRVAVWKNELALMEKIASESMYASLSTEEVKRMFNPNTGNLVVRPVADSMRTEMAHGGTLTLQPKYRDLEKRVRSKGMLVEAGSGRIGDKLHDSTLAEFDVFSHLNRLAVIFDKVDELDSLLEEYGERIPEDVLTGIIEGADAMQATEQPD